MLEKYKKILEKEIAGIIHFSDVFTENNIDFDSELTVTFRNFGKLSDLRYPIGTNNKKADYGANLLNDLLAEQKRILTILEKNSGKKINLETLEKNVIAILNQADRNSITTKDNKNGNNFHLAITDNNLIIFAVPLNLLETLETRNKILALYEIPNELLKTTDGTKEQFRSSIISTTRFTPEILKPIFEYKDTEELLKSKEKNTHPKLIPEQKILAKYAFTDKFGNIRFFVKNNKQFKKNIVNVNFGDKIKLEIGDKKIEVFYVESLKDIPNGEIGIYQNISDLNIGNDGYWEVIKKSENCNFETETAETILKKLNPNFKNEEIKIYI